MRLRGLVKEGLAGEGEMTTRANLVGFLTGELCESALPCPESQLSVRETELSEASWVRYGLMWALS